jgi:hypothetical protein
LTREEAVGNGKDALAASMALRQNYGVGPLCAAADHPPNSGATRKDNMTTTCWASCFTLPGEKPPRNKWETLFWVGYTATVALIAG